MNFSKLKNDNPWGSYDESDRKPRNQQRPNNPDIDDLLERSEEFFKKMFGGGNKGKKNNQNNNSHPKSFIGIIILAIIALWLASGIFKINPEENGLVLLFGKYHKIAEPGLNYHIPRPFGKVIKRSVETVNTEKFEASSVTTSNEARNYFRNRNSNFARFDSLMLTGDENIVDIDFEVQWKISNIRDFVFNMKDPQLAIKKAAESAMREIIAKTPIVSALSDGKRQIESQTRDRLQEILDSYGAGVGINIVQLRRVDPPSQVIDAFRDVQTAKADKEKEINQAESYSNDIIPRARGIAETKLQEAEAYKAQVIADAKGQASRFNAVYRQYSKAKKVTKRRIYLETMEEIYKDINKIIIDKNISKSGMVPYLPINELNKK